MSFANLGLKKDIINIITSLKFKEPLEAQKKVIPLIQQGKNVVFTSRTGSGKTLAYSLGFLSKINIKQNIQMIILVPTRELCIQVGKELKRICDPLNINVGMLYGGRDLKGDYKTTKKRNHIMVGTPGRLIQHINAKSIRVGDVRFLVYDESDQMFDDGFYDECVYVLDRVSKNVQIILASATSTKKVEQFIEEQIIDYERLQIGDIIPKNIVQEKIYCAKDKKNEILLDFFLKHKLKRALIFCNTKLKTEGISEFFQNRNFHIKPFSGALKQEERLNVLNLFKDGQIKALVTTDVAARGLHVENVDVIINYDVPTRDEFYVHRIGRTGRNDSKGYALTLICPEDEERFENIEFDYKLKVKQIDF